MVQREVNDNYCVLNVAGVKDSVHVSGKKQDLNPSPVTSKSETVFLHVNSFVANVPSVTGLPQKKGVNPNYCHNHTEIKYVKCVSCIGHLSSAITVTNVPTVVINPPVGARLQQFWQKWEALGLSPKVVTILREGYTLPFGFIRSPRSPTVISSYVNPQRQSHLLEALYQLTNKNAVEPKLTGLLQPAIFGTQTQQLVDTYPGPQHLEHLPKHRVVQNGDPRDNKDLPPARGVGHLHRLQGRILPYTNSQSVQEIHAFSHPGSVLPVQSPTLWPVHSANGVHSGDQRGQTDGFTEGYKNPPVTRRLVHESHIPPNLSPAYTDLGSSLSRTSLAGERGEVRTLPKTGFQLRRLPVRPQGGQGQTHTRAFTDLNRQDIVNSVRSGVPRLAVHIPHRTSATEKQVHLGRLYMRPIRWHLKNNWRVPESLEKVIPVPRSLHPHLRWWLEESNVLPGQPLHPQKHALQIFTDASKEGWGAHLNERTARGTWSVPESKLHINHLKLKAVFLALKEFQDLCSNNIVLVATDNTTVVAYINKEGGDEVGLPVCPTVENPVLVHQETGNSQGTSHPRPAERDSRQAIQTWLDHSNAMVPSPRGFQSYMLPVAPAKSGPVFHQIQQQTTIVCVTSSGPQAWAVDALSLSWENLDPYAFPPAAKVVEKLQDYPCNRIILIAPGWPNMPWFCDLVAMSSQIPLCLPNLVSQPFNQTLHRNLLNLNLHAWLLEPQQSRSRDSLRQWQHELRLLKEDQPDPSMRQSGPFLQSGASVIRWTSGHHL